jgi:uncharacterized protein (TIGR02246 family)
MNSDEKAIRDLVSRWHTATAAGDIETVLSLMTEDVIFLSTENLPMQGRDSFGTALRGLLKQRRIESSGEVKEIGISGTLAYCWVNLTIRVTPLSGGDSVVRSGSAISILRKQADGSWVVTRDANMLALAS